MADEELPSEGDSGPRRNKGPEREPSEPLGARGPSAKPGPARSGFFTIYKKGQGYWTRMGTAIGAGLLGALTAYELYYQIPPFLHGPTPEHDAHIALGVAIAFLAAYSIWAFWFTNKPSTVDFLIATDSEMKKVNWTTRKELIGSTKVVIWFMLIITLFLFTCDILFGGFFYMVGVLKTWF